MALEDLIRQRREKILKWRELGIPPYAYSWAVTHPCFYGIDTPSRGELIGALKSPEEIREFLGADSIGYLSLEGLLACEQEGGQFCTACFTGSYPVAVDPGASKLSIENLHRKGTALGV